MLANRWQTALPPWAWQAAPWLGWLTLALGLAYVLFTVLRAGDPTDIKYVWIAGHIWAEGGNPYDTDVYIPRAQDLNAFGALPLFMPYPPQWWPVAALLEQGPLEFGGLIWRLLSVPMLLLSAWAVYAALPREERYPLALAAFLLGVGCFIQAVPINIALAQTALLITLGTGLVMHGFATRQLWSSALGLFLVAMKPSAGALFVPLIPFMPQPFVLVPILAVAIGASALPGLVSAGLLPTLLEYGEVIANYGSFRMNAADAVSGLRHVGHLLGVELSGGLCVLIGMAIAGALALAWAPRALAGGTGDRLFFMAVLVALILAVAPLHAYDFAILLPVMIAAPVFRRWDWLAIAVAVLLLLRPITIGNMLLARGLSPVEFPVNTFGTVAGIGLLGAFALSGLCRFGIARAMAALLGGLAVAAAGVAYLSIKALSPEPAIDFEAFYVAGSIWLDGVSPYAADYYDRGRALIGEGRHIPPFFFYPPQWWPMATTIASLDLAPATVVWRLAVAPAILLAVAIAWCALPREGRPALGLVALVAGLACLMSASAGTVALGQSAHFSLIGLALIFVGLLRQNIVALALGLAIACLKPTIGIFFLPLAALAPRPVLTLALVGGMSFVAALPAIVVAGPITLVADYLSHIGSHGALPPNSLNNISGLRHLAAVGGGLVLSMPVITLAGVAVVAGTVFTLWRRGPDETGRAMAFGVATAIMLAFATLHTYDMLLYVALVFALPLLGRIEWAVVGICFLPIMRSANLAWATGIRAEGNVYFVGSLIDSLACLALALGLLACLAYRLFAMRDPLKTTARNVS
ncbi:MAG: glycosyltransferase 87 family protein [Pseudomonadota bacterium]